MKHLTLLYYFLFGYAIIGAAQNPHPAFRQYKTDDGLPDLVVYQAFQDRKGYMWFGTNNGVCRFNGYTFERFPAPESEKTLNYFSAFDFQEDTLGRIWFNKGSGSLYYIEQDSIHVYPHNDSIQIYNFRIGANFYVEGAGERVFMELHRLGIVEVNSDGGHQLHTAKPSSHQIALEMKNDFILHTNSPRPMKWVNSSAFQGLQPPLDIVKAGKRTTWEKFPETVKQRYSRITLLKLSDNDYLLQRAFKLFYIQNDTITWHIPYTEEVLETLQAKDGSFYFCMHHNKGLRKYNSLDAIRTGVYDQLLDNATVTWATEDQNGGLWVTTLGKGVFYTANPNMLVYDQNTGLSSNNVQSITLDQKGGGYIGLQNGEVLYVDDKPNAPTSLTTPSGYLYFVFYDASREGLWLGKNSGFFKLQSNELRIYRYFSTSGEKLGSSISRFAHLSKNGHTLWGANSAGFGTFDLKQEKFTDLSLEYLPPKRIYAIHEAMDGTVWIGGQEGLQRWKNKELQEPKPSLPLLKEYVSQIEQLPDSTLVLGYMGAGIGFWKDSSVVQLTVADGLTFNQIGKLYVDDQGVVWAATVQGLNRITIVSDSTFEIKRYTTADGLPSNVVHDVKINKDFIWIATGEGLVKMPRVATKQTNAIPVIESIKVDGTAQNTTADGKFGYQQNNISLTFFTLNFRQAGRIEYRYRLLPDANWTTTTSLRADYPSLPPDDYVFEVASRQEDGSWGAANVYRFSIQAPFWQTWWFILLCIGIALATVYGIYTYRLRQIQKTNAIEKEIDALKRSALQAQMNPHFIFNCLNSIQNFIALNDKENATMFLGRFAKLVRSTLNASVQEKVSLEEELGLLENYLALEQLRFKNKFNYCINLEDGIDQFDTEIPPLLIQPFVENAIVHGLKGKTEKGMINIDFTKLEE